MNINEANILNFVTLRSYRQKKLHKGTAYPRLLLATKAKSLTCSPTPRHIKLLVEGPTVPQEL